MLFSGCCLSDLALNLFGRRFERDAPAALPIKCSVVDNGTCSFDSKKKTAHLESPSKTSAYSSMKSTATATMSGLAIPAAGEIVPMSGCCAAPLRACRCGWPRLLHDYRLNDRNATARRRCGP